MNNKIDVRSDVSLKLQRKNQKSKTMKQENLQRAEQRMHL